MQTTTTEKRNKFIMPVDLEIMNTVIKAACQYFNITEEDLMSEPVTADHTHLRRVCIYLILTNTSLYHSDIADRFRCVRSTVTRVLPIIQIHRGIYAPTRNMLNTIANLANSFEKKHEWHLQ